MDTKRGARLLEPQTERACRKLLTAAVLVLCLSVACRGQVIAAVWILAIFESTPIHLRIHICKALFVLTIAVLA